MSRKYKLYYKKCSQENGKTAFLGNYSTNLFLWSIYGKQGGESLNNSKLNLNIMWYITYDYKGFYKFYLNIRSIYL